RAAAWVRATGREGIAGRRLRASTGDVARALSARWGSGPEAGCALARAEIADELEAGANSSTAQSTGQCTNCGSPRPASAQGLLEIQPGEHGSVVARPALEDLVEGGVAG